MPQFAFHIHHYCIIKGLCLTFGPEKQWRLASTKLRAFSKVSQLVPGRPVTPKVPRVDARVCLSQLVALATTLLLF